jgi:hypothetical protein
MNSLTLTSGKHYFLSASPAYRQIEGLAESCRFSPSIYSSLKHRRPASPDMPLEDFSSEWPQFNAPGDERSSFHGGWGYEGYGDTVGSTYSGHYDQQPIANIDYTQNTPRFSAPGPPFLYSNEPSLNPVYNHDNIPDTPAALAPVQCLDS